MSKFACVVFELENDEQILTVMEKLRDAVCNKGAEICVVDNLNQAAGHIKACCASVKTKVTCEEWRENLKALLSELGVTPHLMGYEELFYVMENLSKSPIKTKSGYFREAYTYATKICNKSVIAVERNIRSVIELVCKYNTNWELSQIMGIPINDNMKITNSTFITLLSQVIFK